MKKIICGLLMVSGLLLATETVYVVNEKKYHATKSCRTLKRSKNIREISIASIGSRTACKVCY